MKDVRSPAVDMAHMPLAAVRRSSSALRDYVALTKPRLNFLVVVSSAAGYYLGAPLGPSLLPMIEAVAGTALVAGGAAVLNQVYERDTDALMLRTRARPLPAGRVTATDAQIFGMLFAVAGTALLASAANLLAAALAVTTVAVYLGAYTPMKRRSSAATFVGAIPGALPPLIGWTAARGSLAGAGLALFAIVFLWQIPHFMAIAWLYRDDYGRAGLPMLPVIEPDGRRTGAHAAGFAAALLPVSVTPALLGVSGPAYFACALLLGVGLLWLAARFRSDRSESTARALFFGSISYLPLLWAAMMLDH